MRVLLPPQLRPDPLLKLPERLPLLSPLERLPLPRPLFLFPMLELLPKPLPPRLLRPDERFVTPGALPRLLSPPDPGERRALPRLPP